MHSLARRCVLTVGIVLALTGCGDPTTIVRTDTVFIRVPDTTGTIPPTSSQWVILAGSPEPRRGHGSAVVDGTIYVIGGSGSGLTTSILAYAPATNSWRTAGTLLGGVFNPGVVAIDGRIYVVGGVDAAVESGMTRLQIFDPRTGTVVDGPAMPSRRWFFAVAVFDGKIHVMGGDTDGDEFDSWPAYDHDVFDPVTNTWSTRADIPTMSNLHGAATVGGKIYVAATSGHIHQYDPATDSWSELNTFFDDGHWVLRKVVAHADKIYFVGGHKWPTVCCNGPQPSNEVHRFDPASLTWETMPPMSTPHGEHAAAVAGGSIYGILGTSGYGNVIERFTPR